MRRTRRIRPAQRGYVRTAGYYGRYQRGGELKFFDTDIATAFGSIDANLELVNLNIIVQGNTESNRIGRKITLRRVDCKGILTLPTTATAASTSNVVKLMLVCDKQTNGAAFVAADLLETDDFGSFNNLANSSRFKIIQTKTYSQQSQAGSGRGSTDTLSYGEDVVFFKMGATLNLPIEFDNSATTGVVTSQRSNSLWMVAISTSGHSIMTKAQARVRFTDV